MPSDRHPYAGCGRSGKTGEGDAGVRVAVEAIGPSIIIPVRPPEEGKSRLAAVLSPEERAVLNRHFFDHVLDVALRLTSRCLVVSRSPEILQSAQDAGATAIREEGFDLNAALHQAALQSPGAEPVLTLSCDLPYLTREDLIAMLNAGRSHEIVAATDREGRGTNALLLRSPGLIPYRYGPDSLAAHAVEARDRGMTFAPFTSPGLARDIDTPSHLAEFRSFGRV